MRETVRAKFLAFNTGAFFQPINEYANRTQVDSVPNSFRVWTSDLDGDGTNWTTLTGQRAQTYLAQWRRLSDGAHACDRRLGLYCFERGQQFAFSPPAIVHKQIFLSTVRSRRVATTGPMHFAKLTPRLLAWHVSSGAARSGRRGVGHSAQWSHDYVPTRRWHYRR